MSDEFDRILRESLQGRAEDARHADLAQGALQQAGRIRRRRRVTAGVGVLAAVALAVPIGAQVVDESTDHIASKPTNDGSGQVSVAIDGLSEGSAPTVPYIDGETFHGSSVTIALPKGKGQIVDAAEVSPGALLWRLDPADGRTSVKEVAATNEAMGSIPALRADVTSPTVNTDRGEVAWAADSGANGNFRTQQVIIVHTDNGEATGAGANGDKVLQVMGVADSSVVYNVQAGKERLVRELDVRSGRSTTPWEDATYVTAVDTDLQKFAGHTADMTGDRSGCTKVVDRDEPEEGWETCDWRPVEFSVDGSLVLAIPPNSDGLGPRQLAVLDADTGDLEQVLTTKGTFGRATFEGDSSVMAVLAEGDQAAIVRCGIESGDCERATPAATVTPDDPDSLVAPYQLTAN